MNGTFKRQSALACNLDLDCLFFFVHTYRSRSQYSQALAGAVAADSGLLVSCLFEIIQFYKQTALDTVRAASKDTLRAVKKTCGSCANNKAKHKATM
jgi:hypothetical protein